MLLFIRREEPAPGPAGADSRRDFFTEMKEGIRVVTGNSLLWTQAGCTATVNFGSSIFSVAVILFAYRVLLFTPAEIGIPFSIGAVGFVVGVFISSRVTSTLGVGRSIALAAALPMCELLALLATSGFKIEVLGAAMFLSSLGIPIYNINQVSLRQIITPDRLQGRMNATMRTIVWGTIPLGSFIGGVLVTLAGVTPTLIVGAVISGGSFVWILFGPIFGLKRLPEPAADHAPD
jgi:predicted MFS family arabinose efflux permease